MGSDLTQRRLVSEPLYTGATLTLRRDRVALPDGQHVLREVVEHPGAVVVIPLIEDEEILFVRQYRYPAGQVLLELPAGTLEPGENPRQAAARELEEEVGYRPGRLLLLGSFFSAPGFCTEILHCFLADALDPGRRPGDPDEQIEVLRLSLAEAITRALAGAIRDAKSLAALFLLVGHRGLLTGESTRHAPPKF